MKNKMRYFAYDEKENLIDEGMLMANVVARAMDYSKEHRTGTRVWDEFKKRNVGYFREYDNFREIDWS